MPIVKSKLLFHNSITTMSWYSFPINRVNYLSLFTTELDHIHWCKSATNVLCPIGAILEKDQTSFEIF